MDEYDEIERAITDNAQQLVGILLKRLEDLNLSNGNSLTFEQIKQIYKSIVKNSIYENSRNLKKLIKTLELGKIIFTTPK